MNNLTFSVNKVTGLSVRFLSVFFCLFVVCATAEAGNTFKYNYSVTVAPQTSNPGRGKVYMDAKAEFLYEDKTKWADLSDSKNTELYNANQPLTVSVSKNNENKNNQKSPWIQYTSVTLKAEALAGSKFTKWSWTENSEEKSSTAVTISIPCPERLQMDPNDDDDTESRSCPITYTAHFTPRTYYYKMLGADANEGGAVYISTTAGRPADDSGDWQTTIAGGTTTLSQIADDNGRYARATLKVYCYAKSPGANYEFLGWYAATGGVLSTSLDFEYDYVVTSENSSKPTTNTMHAVFRPINTVTTITADNVATINLYTGTEIFQAGHATYGKSPYRKKTRLDLRPTFAPDGTPLFDKLYVFGMTISGTPLTVSGVVGHNITAASNAIGSNAITPCYIYTNNGSGGYDLTQTILNMNVANKPIQDISGATSIYLTGYCPYASTGGGNNQDENGVIAFTGGAGVNTHVYVDDLQLYARYKSQNGNVSKPDTVLFSGLQTLFYCSGTSTAFSFKGTSEKENDPYKPIIHMRDSNRLTGTTGSAIKVEIEFLGMSMTQVAGQYNSPIGILNNDNGKAYTELSIDDVWPASMVDNAASEVRTNGYLDIRGGSGAPSIDLYDDKGKVNFNGGRYYLKNSRPTGSNNYLCTFAVGYRKYVKEVSGIEATMYGLGTDQSGGEVNFNDGSFYVDTLTNDEWTKHGKYYHHKYALKCPASSTINGGTFYCEPFASTDSENKGASPLNRYGDGLVLDTVAVESLLEPYHTAVINFPNDKEVQDEYAATYPATLGEYYTAKGGTYGISSLNPYQGMQAPDSVILMLPVQYTDKKLQNDVVNVPWALCVPEVVAGATIEMGGNIEVSDREENNTIYQTNYILYGTLDEHINGISSEYQTPVYDGLPQASVEFPGGWSSDVENTKPYTIQQEQYMLMSVKADEWFLFAPPFDISEVYVVETYKEDELAAMAKSTSWQEAINLQAAANMDFFYALCYNIGYLKTPNGLDAIYYDWSVTLAKNNNAKGKIKLNHFTGSNWDKANYYVQRSSGTWEWDSEKSRFKTDWEYLPTTMEKVTHGETEYSVVMKKGEIYSLNFPYMYNGYREKGDGNGNKNWDYWTGKYILFVGKGPQTIEGKNHHDTIIAPMKVSTGYAEIRANSTFASMEVSDMGAYYLGENQRFTPSIADEELTPIDATQGFVLLNKPTVSPMPQRIASIELMTGDVTYEPVSEDATNETPTSTPTIDGGHGILVYSTMDGLLVIPVVPQQVNIYNTSGQLVASQYLTEETQFTLPMGIYLVRGETDQAKALVQ